VAAIATFMLGLALAQASALPRPARTPPAAGASKAGKPTPASARATLEGLLRSSSSGPSATDLAAVGRNVDELLVTIARDASLELPLRARAVGALAKIPTNAARAFLVALIEDPQEALAPAAARRPRGKPAPLPDAGAQPLGQSDDVSRTLVRRAAVSLGWIGGSLAPRTLGPLLAHSDPDVRADAAVGLALTRLPEAVRLLRARLPVETDGRVRGHIARQLTVIESALGPLSPVGAPATPSAKPVGPPPRSEF
jgi:HEAT repeat protein